MAEIITNDLKHLIVDQLYFSLCTCSQTTYHMVGAEPTEFSIPVPAPVDSVYETTYNIHDKMLFGKVVNPDDVSYMIPNVPWEAGAKYDYYDDKDGDLKDKNFFVVADQDDGSYAVFKCLYKTPFTDPVTVNKPNVNQTSPEDDIYITGDGYHWKYMFTIPSATYTKFATANYVPFVEDVDVTANAVAGSIDAILIENAGVQYNNYASGRIRESAVDGNTLRFSLDSDTQLELNTYDVIYTSNSANTFSEGDTVNITVPGANTVQGEVFKTGPSTISFALTANTESITEATVVSSNGYIQVESTDETITSSVVRIRRENVPTLSTNDNFYKDATIYLRAGLGAGQTKKITAYDSNGNDRIITVDTAFDTLPDTSTTFSITPTIDITGDGTTNAVAIPIIDTTANSIVDIQILNRGEGYTFAETTVVGNTGIIDANGDVVFADEASIRATITPELGHGSDIVEELFGTNLGISVKFANNEVLPDISYNTVALVRNLLQNDIELTLDSYSAGTFEVGEVVDQANTKASGEISSLNNDSGTITLTNVFGDFEASNNSIIGLTSNTSGSIASINRSTDIFNNTVTLTITPITGSFVAGETITQTNTDSTAYVVSANATSLVISNLMNNFTTNITDNITGGTSSARAFVNAVTDSKVVDNSGDVIYIENTQQIDRSSDSSETVKLIIKF